LILGLDLGFTPFGNFRVDLASLFLEGLFLTCFPI